MGKKVGLKTESKSTGPSADVDTLLDQANQQLSRVKLRQRQGKLYIRSSYFPPKPGEREAGRSEIATSCTATAAGLKIALLKARDIDLAILTEKFDWTPYLSGRLKSYKSPEKVGEWLKRFEESHWERTPRNPNKENSFRKGYRSPIKRLPQDEPLTVELLRKFLVENSAAGTRNRLGLAMAFRKLGEFAGLEKEALEELRELGKGYTAASVDPRNLPTDDEILDIWESITNPGWRWLIGAQACFGLRNHETWSVEIEGLSEDPACVRVPDNSKTGYRLVYPMTSPGWDLMELKSRVLPDYNTTGKSNNDLGTRISNYFRDHKLTAFAPYDMRHCYARRLYEKGFSADFAAKMMGHSLDVHLTVYRQWWGDTPYQKEYKRIMGDGES